MLTGSACRMNLQLRLILGLPLLVTVKVPIIVLVKQARPNFALRQSLRVFIPLIRESQSVVAQPSKWLSTASIL